VHGADGWGIEQWWWGLGRHLPVLISGRGGEVRGGDVRREEQLVTSYQKSNWRLRKTLVF